MKYKNELEKAFAKQSELAKELTYIWLAEFALVVILVAIMLF